MPETEKIQKQIEAFRRKLLDLTLRNRMLNYRPSKRLSVEIKRELSVEVLRILVEEGRKMTFLGVPDPPKRLPTGELYDAADTVAMAEFRQQAEDELTAYLGNPDLPVSQADTKLTTDEYESILQVKLRAMQREAALAKEELGINTLFLTLGVLEWSEDEERTFIAPLVFVPVTLEKNQNGVIRIVHDGSDPGTNLPLRQKLAEHNMSMPEWDDEEPLFTFQNEMTSTVAKRENWAVHRDMIHLGFFNYEKYAMYIDLGGENWPEGRKPWQDTDILSILGDGYPYRDDDLEGRMLDEIRPPAECHEVYDSDSSQTAALVRAAEGLSMVIEGPPGTGKSQTITNIIAEAVAAGKTVLFVSAKRAAVEVVKRRLSVAGLSDMVLDLHDKLTNRKQFYSEIKRTTSVNLSLKNEHERVARLTELRELLNEHSAAVNDVLPPYGIAPFDAMIRLSRLPAEVGEDREGRLPFEEIKSWSTIGMGKVEATLQALQERVKEIGVPKDHPYWGCQIRVIDPSIRLDLREDVGTAQRLLAEAIEAVEEAANQLHVPVPASAEDVRVLRACVSRAEAAPALTGIALSATWREQEPQVRQVIEDLNAVGEIKVNRGPQVTLEAWSRDLAEPLASLVDYAPKWYRIFIGAFRRAKKEVRPLLTGPVPDPVMRDIVVDLQDAFTRTKRIQSADELMRTLFGVQWEGTVTDPMKLEKLLEWMLGLKSEIDKGEIPAGFIRFLSGEGVLAEARLAVAVAEEKSGGAIEAYREACRVLHFDDRKAHLENLKELASRVQRWADSEPLLASYVNFSEARAAALEVGLGPAVRAADEWPHAGDRLVEAALRSYYLGIVREAMEVRPALRKFERLTQERMIADFRRLDDFMLQYNRARVRIAHHARMPKLDNALGNLKHLKVQCELQRSHKPIRWAMARSGEAIQAIKPVFMMSPLSVAIHLPPEMPPFDMVIFDEASQVKPEDALCAIARAKQTIVVGDTRQMPPTNFFDRVGEGDDLVDEMDEDMADVLESAKLESILSLMSAAVLGRARRPDLRWHYRSIHPGLIQPSNEMFYENRLIVFPSADQRLGGSRVGTVFHHRRDTVYEPGSQKRINRLEAEQVADAVLNHVQTEPHLSLMVAAMNKAQADLIYQEVEKRKRLHPEAFAAYKPANAAETIEIKNLETVQGDERDVVFISITYGRDASGVLRQHFGPILKEGGERRLNVLISRARRRCEVFTNITSDDIKAEAGQTGLVTLKRYLGFAESGTLEASIPTGMVEESPFEEEVSDALRARGYTVDPQVGCAGFRIDLSVVDPDQPGRYLLGIECDGATYHSARSARDRDKLREVVLTDRGWRLHRIWSHDWWQDKAGEIERLVAAIEEEPLEIEPEPTDDEETDFLLNAPPVVTALGKAPPYVVTEPLESPIKERDLPAYLLKVIQTEGPINLSLVLLRLRKAEGFAKTTQQMRERYSILVGSLISAGHVRVLSDAYVSLPGQESLVRDWSEMPDRTLDYLTVLELSNAVLAVVRASFGISREEAVKMAYGRLGFKRVGDEGQRKGREVLDFLVASGALKDEAGSLKVG